MIVMSCAIYVYTFDPVMDEFRNNILPLVIHTKILDEAGV